jgi:hypothetical protein
MSSTNLVEQLRPGQPAIVDQRLENSSDLLPLFIVFITLGFAVGAILPIYLAEAGTSFARLFGAAFAFGSVGASAGLLAVGCYDVIVQGRLEE